MPRKKSAAVARGFSAEDAARLDTWTVEIAANYLGAISEAELIFWSPRSRGLGRCGKSDLVGQLEAHGFHAGDIDTGQNALVRPYAFPPDEAEKSSP
jgi:hypothetical protein